MSCKQRNKTASGETKPQAEKQNRINSACRACQMSTHAAAIHFPQVTNDPLAMVSSATPQPSAQPAAAAPSTPSCNDTTAAKSDPSGLIATSVATLATLAAKTTPKASVQPATTIQSSPAFIATATTTSNKPPSTTAPPTSQTAATTSLNPSFTQTPTHKSNATPTDTTIPIATTATLAAKTTPYTHAQVAPAAEACFGLINCPASAASAQSATTTQSPPTFTATPSTKSTTSTTNITPAAGATCALIKRAPVAVSPSTPTPLPRPVATPFFTPATFTTKPRPIDAVPSATVDFTPVQQAQPSQSILGDCTLHTVAINTSTTAQRHTHRRQASHTYIQDNLHT